MKKTYQQHVPSVAATEALDQIRYAFSQLHEKIERMVPPSRERSVALTELETAAMWVTKAIIHNDPMSLPSEPA